MLMGVDRVDVVEGAAGTYIVLRRRRARRGREAPAAAV